MNELPLQHGVAARWATIMLGATALAGALTLGVFLLPRPEAPALELASAEGSSGPKAPRKLPTEGIKSDWSRVASDVDRINAPEVRAWEKEQQAEKERLAAAQSQVDPTAPASPGNRFKPNWRYLGAIINGLQKTAVVVVPEEGGVQRQRFVGEGFKKDEYTLVSIEPSKLIVEQGQTRHEIPITASTRGQSLAAGSATAPITTNRPIPLPGSVVPPSALPANRGGVSERSRDLIKPPKFTPPIPPGSNPMAQPGMAQPASPDMMTSPTPPPEPAPPGTR